MNPAERGLWLPRSSVGASPDAPASRGATGRWSGRDCIPTRSVGTRKTACAGQSLPPPQRQGDTRGVTLTFFAPEVTPEVGLEVTPEVRALLQAVAGELARRDLQERLGLKDAEHFRKHYLLPAIERGLLEMTLPDRRNSSRQRYRLTDLGRRIVAPKRSDA